jgi:hypothetical protein
MFTIKQVRQLLRPVRPERVLKDGKGMSHLAQQDVTAHLTRIFGFGNWSKEILFLEPVFEMQRANDPANNSNWDVSYRCTIRLTVWEVDDDGERTGRTWTTTDGSTGDAQNSKRWDAHDLALKSAISLSLKRCAKDLGDQFGLSLYNKGSLRPIVMGLINPPTGLIPDGTQEPDKDVQEDVEAPQGDGIDEKVHDKPEPSAEQQAALANSVGAK